MPLNVLVIVFSFLLCLACGAEEAAEVYSQAIAKLKESQTDRTAIVPATRLLAQAADLYEKAGDEAKVIEINSYLYWTKKKFTLADATALKTAPQVSQRIESAMKVIPLDQAKAMLDKADVYAKSHADDPLLVAIRYFEVADRFKDSDPGRIAMDSSLKAMQRIGTDAKRETYKATATDGKAFIKTEPLGATILLVTKDGGKLETGKVTPVLLQLPLGFQTVELSLKGFKPHLLTVEIDGKTIAKPESVKLEAITTPLDVIFEDGWTIFVAGKPAKVSGPGRPETPCTIELPLGTHQLTFAKEGYVDITQRFDVKSLEDKVTIEPKTKPVKGKSVILGSVQTAASGKIEAPKTRGKALLGTLHACGDDQAEIAVNGKVIHNVSWQSSASVDTDLAIGDVITVKLSNTGGPFGFAMVFKSNAGVSLRSSTASWFCYTPTESSIWWSVPINSNLKAIRGDSEKPAEHVKSASKVECESLWPASLKNNEGYLYHVVRENSFK